MAEAVSWLDAHVDLESSVPNRRALPTLSRMQELTGLLGSPERSFPAVHVTGTNGKGSTVALISSIFAELGFRVGTYTSPNLERINERMAVDGAQVEDSVFVELMNVVAAAEASMSERATRFELLTGAALRWFSDEAVDVAVVEVGLGGSWDSTNVVDGRVAVLTNVSYDHTDVLGPTLEGIARDKSGIIKPGSSVVIGETAPSLVGIMEDAATNVGAGPTWARGREFDCVRNLPAVGGRLVDVSTPLGAHEDIMVPLHGRHQGLNASCAIAASEAFLGASLTEDVLANALGSVAVPGRLEVVGRHPLCLVDGAHNVAGMDALATALREEFAVPGDRVAVVGMLGGRDPIAMLEPLRAAGVERVVACAPRSPRAISSKAVADAARAVGQAASTEESVAGAISAVLATLGSDGLLVTAGSLYVVGEARSYFLDRVQSPD
jgi:dihydrofolate synthase/folylpolyglutamate synthase